MWCSTRDHLANQFYNRHNLRSITAKYLNVMTKSFRVFYCESLLCLIADNVWWFRNWVIKIQRKLKFKDTRSSLAAEGNKLRHDVLAQDFLDVKLMQCLEWSRSGRSHLVYSPRTTLHRTTWAGQASKLLQQAQHHLALSSSFII